MPALLSSLTDASGDDLSAVLAGDGPSRPCLREWLSLVPDPRRPPGRWHPLQFVLALAVCAFTAAGHDSPSAIADWASGCSQQALAALGGRRDPWTGKVRAPCERSAYAAIRNLVIGATRHAGFASIAHARRHYARDDQRILALYGYA